MVRVPAVKSHAKRATTASSAGAVSVLPPTQVELMQRTCALDAASMTASWTGLDATCACRRGYFGQDCATSVSPAGEIEKTVGAKGGSVKVGQFKHAVTIPEGALTQDVIVSVAVFKKADLGGELYEKGHLPHDD